MGLCSEYGPSHGADGASYMRYQSGAVISSQLHSLVVFKVICAGPSSPDLSMLHQVSHRSRLLQYSHKSHLFFAHKGKLAKQVYVQASDRPIWVCMTHNVVKTLHIGCFLIFFTQIMSL